MARDIQYIVIHCTAGSKNTKAETLAEFFVKPVSQGGRGWTRGGYHYIIEGNGNIKSMIPENEVSNGVAGKNSICLNISYCGGVKQDANGKNVNPNIPQDTRTDAQRKSLIQLVNDLKKKYPKAKVVSHNFFTAKACPSFNAGKEYGGLTGKEGGNATIVASKGGSVQAAKSQIEQFKIAYEAVGKSLTEFPDTILDQINSVYDTYKTVVETVAKAQQKIPITIPDPMKPINEMMTNFKDATKGFVENGKDVMDYVIPVPDGTEIEGRSLDDLLKDMGIMSILSDLISPATDFIKDAPSIVDQTLTGVKKSVSGAAQGFTTSSGLITSALKPEPYTEEDKSKSESTGGILGTLDNGIESVGNYLQTGSNLVAGGLGAGLNTISGTANIANEALSGTASLALGTGAAVAGILAKVPGVIPKAISYAISYAAKKSIQKAQETAANTIMNKLTVIDATMTGKKPTEDAGDDSNIAAPMAVDFIEESSPIIFNTETKLTSPISDTSNNIYQDEFITTIGEIEQTSIDAYNDSIKNESLSNDEELTDEEKKQIEEEQRKQKEKENQEKISEFLSEEDAAKCNPDNIMQSINDAEKEANESIITATTSESAASNSPHIETIEDEELIEKIASNNQKINSLEEQFRQTFLDEKELEKFNKLDELKDEEKQALLDEIYPLKLYIELRKSFLEILPEIQDENSGQNFVNMATYAALKITPAVINYIDKKFESIEEKINNLIGLIVIKDK